MRWSNVWLIFRREARDQLRDRRTLFMIFVLPILLYPILGIGMAQLLRAFEEKVRTVAVLGAEHLPAEPPLLNAEGTGFDPALIRPPSEARLLRVQREGPDSVAHHPEAQRALLHSGRLDAIVTVPPGTREAIAGGGAAPEFPIAYDSADEQSRDTYRRVRDVLDRWTRQILDARLARDERPRSYVEPVTIEPVDVATVAEAGGSVWARIFPFLLVMMALTGAFYPAVDLCAGEKERGTMETLLISPASRGEIVLGKYLTVMAASIITALLNLASMGLTGWQLARQMGSRDPAEGARRAAAILTPPTLSSAAWMVMLLIPLSAFFSALCLALAVLARSMKEGQYYMTPLYLVTLPLVFMTLAPGIDLDLFTSLIPVTGVSLLLRSLMQGDYGVARRFFLPVLVPTLVYGALALRWAVDQFRREDVLFREAERFELASYLRHLVRDRGPTPTPGQAILCFVLMLASAWFLFGWMASSALGMAAGQVAFIMGPPVAIALVLTSRPRRTLRLYWPGWRSLAAAVALVLALNPLVAELRMAVEWLFPISEVTKVALEQMMAHLPGLGTALVLLAVVPGICEEVAFRGTILSGLEHGYSTRTAIVLSALLFGFLHVLLSLFQQLFNATLLGLILGLLAVRSGSLLPGIVFHVINNGLALVLGAVRDDPRATWIFRRPEEALYHWPWVALGAVASAGLLAWLVRTPGPGPAEPGEGPHSGAPDDR